MKHSSFVDILMRQTLTSFGKFPKMDVEGNRIMLQRWKWWEMNNAKINWEKMSCGRSSKQKRIRSRPLSNLGLYDVEFLFLDKWSVLSIERRCRCCCHNHPQCWGRVPLFIIFFNEAISSSHCLNVDNVKQWELDLRQLLANVQPDFMKVVHTCFPTRKSHLKISSFKFLLVFEFARES